METGIKSTGSPSVADIISTTSEKSSGRIYSAVPLVVVIVCGVETLNSTLERLSLVLTDVYADAG